MLGARWLPLIRANALGGEPAQELLRIIGIEGSVLDNVATAISRVRRVTMPERSGPDCARGNPRLQGRASLTLGLQMVLGHGAASRSLLAK